MKRLNNDIKEKQFQKVYLLYGDEDYLKENYKKRLREAISGEDEMNYLYSEGKETDLPKWKDFTDTMPFFADKRLLILENTGLFKTASDGFPEWIDALPESAVVIFIESEIDKRNRLYKKVLEKGYASELSHPDEGTLQKWILGIIGQRKLSVTKAAYERFRELSGNAMDPLRNELTKLCDYCASKGTITEEDVELIVTPVIESRIFQMVETVSAGNHEKSMELYYDLLSLREPPMRILYLISRQLNQLMLVKEMSAGRAGREEISAALGVKPFVAGKLSDQASRFTLKSLKENIRFSCELEEAVKTGDLTDTIAVELLIHRLTNR